MVTFRLRKLNTVFIIGSMRQFELGKHTIDKSIILRLGVVEDLAQLLELHHANLYDHLTKEQRNDGFIRIKYSESDFLTIITCQEIVVACHGSELIGYYLIARKSGSSLLHYQSVMAEEIAACDNVINDAPHIGYGAQICIKREFRNNGLFKSLLTYLCLAVKNSYSLLLCTVSEANINSLDRHLRLGWRIHSVENHTCFLTYKINKNNRV